MESIETIMMNRININKIFFCSKQMKSVNLNNCSVCKCRSNCNSRISFFGNVKIKQKGVI